MPKKMPDAIVLTPPPTAKRKPKTAAQKASNRRTRATPMVAALTCLSEARGEVCLVVDDVLTKNERYRLVSVPTGKSRNGRPTSRAAMVESELAEDYKRAVKAAAVQALPSRPGDCHVLHACAGLWRLDVLSVWPTQRHHADGTDTANGDSDAPIAMVKDALQHAGVIDDDMRIAGETTHAVYRKGVRATVAVLRPVGAEDHAAGCEPLLRLLGLPC